ncbi:HAMP domain-containing sensor histidine kinase [Pseudovibrio exalbescens]|uniref:sensor histidine kinase n=1 Tax=Pseudovibrio exalbescens TaxID=197461 RepID=UPI002367369B|nr:HAMP domain-containing sensor histidine kinase [Pseudovibrio exalbescens]MDD7909063.1 HAMP domain-containing sensor histidine kinase [Pseudovibrio exalbescens]
MSKVNTTGRNETNKIDGARAARRRQFAQTLRSNSGRLNSKPAELGFEPELVFMFVKNRLSAAYALPLFMSVVAAISSLWLPLMWISGWLFGALALHLLINWRTRRIELKLLKRRKLKSIKLQLTLSDGIYGLIWTSFLLLSLKPMPVNGLDVFQFATVLIVIAMSTMLSSALPTALLAATVPITATLVVCFMNYGSSIHFAMAAMAIGAQGFFIILSHQLHASALTMLATRAEKDDLIAEMEQVNALALESRRRAEEANLAKSRFLATMSHELRTPLNAILGFSEVMKDEVLGKMQNQTYLDYASDIHKSGQHLLNLINEILDLSRVEAGRYELNEAPLPLDEVVEACKGMMQMRIKAKNLSLSERYEANLPLLVADERAVRQMVLNLLANAVKFTPDEGEIFITVGSTEMGGQFVSIADNGPGIPEDEIPLVLQAFGQGSQAIQGAEQGTGLGLSIVQALAHMHDGRFDLDSKMGEGTIVRIEFPPSRVVRDPSSPFTHPENSFDGMLKAG